MTPNSSTRVLLILSCAFNPPPLTGYGSKRFLGDERVQQYVNGFQTFFSDNNLASNFDVLITDNTVASVDEIDRRIVSSFPPNSKAIFIGNNEIGKLNNGAGLIFTWTKLSDIIKDYDWVVHHEPRQKMRHMNFIKSFLSNPRNLMTINKDHGKHFNTGLFCIRSSILLDYCQSTDLVQMVQRSISIEDHLYDYFINQKINFDVEKEMGLTWYPYGENPKDY